MATVVFTAVGLWFRGAYGKVEDNVLKFIGGTMLVIFLIGLAVVIGLLALIF